LADSEKVNPHYQFGDAAAMNVPQRYYRLRYP
jgi:hypothetical protein